MMQTPLKIILSSNKVACGVETIYTISLYNALVNILQIAYNKAVTALLTA